MLKIVITGPESSGKTTLAQQLAQHYACGWVPEYARSYLEQLGRPYRQQDLLDIAQGQLQLEERQQALGGELLICDTDLLTIKIWSEVKYQTCDPWIQAQVEKRTYDWYFLCGVDIPWVDDPLREHPTQRAALWKIYDRELRNLRKGFMELYGTEAERRQKAIDQIDALLAGLTYNRFF
ncbi:MAG: ATP-binding protein [Bacteroidota bacterium]